MGARNPKSVESRGEQRCFGRSRDTGVPRRTFLKAVAGGALGLGLTSCGTASREPRSAGPNLVVVILDALRAASLSVYGNPRRTAPFIEELAGRSILFERCYAASSWTKPSVTSLLTGLTPVEHGDNRVESVLRPDLETFPKALRRVGYRTGFFTANLILADEYGAEHHFDHVSAVQPGRLNGYELMERVEAWLGSLEAGPVCTYVHFFQPHAPYDPPQEYLDRIHAEVRRVPPSPRFLRDEHRDVKMSPINDGDRGRLPLYEAHVFPSSDPIDHLVRYEANVLFADALLSEFFQLWARRRRAERTLFLVTADHGECLGEHGLFAAHGKLLANPLLHVPLLLHDTRGRAGRVETPVSHLDLAPSLVALAGAPDRLGSVGEPSLVDPLGRRGRQGPTVSQFVSNEYGVGRGAEFAWALTLGDWRLVYNDACGLGPANLMAVVCGEGPSRTAKRGGLPVPRTALPRPRRLERGVELESLALHAVYAIRGRATTYSGRVVTRGKSGTLTIRFRSPGEPPWAVGRHVCGAGETRISGELPPLPGGAGTTGIVVCEGRWDPARGTDPAPGADAWQQLLSFVPFPEPSPAGPSDLELLGADLEPAVVTPGDAVRIETAWRCVRTPERVPELVVQLADTQSRVLVERRTRFLPGYLSEDEQNGKLGATLFPGFRFDQTLRLEIPGRAAPGRYALRLGWESPGAFRELGTLRVVEDLLEACRDLTDAERDLRHYAMLGRDPFLERCRRPDAGPLLERLAGRFPDEGHLDYLCALGMPAGEARVAALRSCVEKTPFHRKALAERAGAEAGRRPGVEALEPPRGCDFTFDQRLRLYGYAIERSARDDDRALYLTLFWEPLAPLAEPLAVDLLVPHQAHFWFLGSGGRPSLHSKVGEAVLETVRVSLAAGGSTWNAGEFLASASHATEAWPGRPDWRRVEAIEGRVLHMTAWEISDPDVTRIEVPLGTGGPYVLSGDVELRGDCGWPTQLELALVSQAGSAPLEELLVQPGEKRRFRTEFRVEAQGVRLVLRYRMKPGAENHHNSNLWIRDFRFTGPRDRDLDAMRLPLRVAVYPHWEFVHSGWTQKGYLGVRRSGSPAGRVAELGAFRVGDLARAPQDRIGSKRARRESFQLFDLTADPAETEDLAEAQPEVFDELKRRFLELADRLGSLPGSGEAPAVELPEAKREQLRALGYLD